MKPALWQAHSAEESRAELMQSALLSLPAQLSRLDRAAAQSTRSYPSIPKTCHGQEVVFTWELMVNLCSLRWGIACVFFPWRCDIAAMVCCQTPRRLRRGVWGFAPLLAAALLGLLFAGMQQTAAFPSWRLEVCCDHIMTYRSCHCSSPCPAYCLVCN